MPLQNNELTQNIQLGENNHKEYGWSNNIGEKITQFFYQLVRTSNKKEINKLKDVYNELIVDCFFTNNNTIHVSNIYKYIILIIPLHTRDIIAGKGEYELFYVLMSVLCRTIDGHATNPLYEETCNKLFNIVKRMIKKTLIALPHQHQYGSWKDVKYFLNYMKTDYGNEKNVVTHPLFHYIMELVCIQLNEDKSHKPSLMTKWLPREKSKKFGWQAKHMAKYIFADLNNGKQSHSSEKKCLTNYRKLIASMNKKLNTTQIDQCNKTWSKINFDKNVTSITLHKQKYAFQNIYKNNMLRTIEVDRLQCSSNYLEYIKRCENKKTTIKSARVEIVDMVREALRLTKTNNQDANIFSALNMQWSESGKNIKNMDNFIAMVDTSHSMTAENSNPLHSAIGLGIRIAEKSKLGKQIMTFSEDPTWINLENENTLTEMASKIENDSSWQVNTNFEAALRLILRTYIIKDVSPDDVKNMVLVVLSDMQIDQADKNATSMNSLIKELFYEAGKYTSHKQPYEPCHILFWNLRSSSGFPCLSTEQNVSMLSGFSPQLLNTFCNEGIDGVKNFTPWNSLLAQLQNERYTWVKEYVNNI